MINTLTRTFSCTIVLALVLMTLGCASGPPKPRRYVRDAIKADEVDNCELVLKNIETLSDIFPHELAKKRNRNLIPIYRENQIEYGFTQSNLAYERGNFVEAWVWAVQTSVVEPEKPECWTMAQRAQELRVEIATDFLAQARKALSANQREKAFSLAVRSAWYGSGEQGALLIKTITQDPVLAELIANNEIIQETDVRGILRTDSVSRFGLEKSLAPYGIPIYFGDVPRYYLSLGEIEVKGVPVPKELPAAYSIQDSLYFLTHKALRRDADAIINVRFLTKRKKPFTIGEAIKFADFPPLGTEAHPIQVSTAAIVD